MISLTALGIRPAPAPFELWEDGVLVYSDEMTKQEPLPELPAEVHHTEPFDADRAWRATTAMCEGVR
jgi:hypothetical protein